MEGPSPTADDHAMRNLSVAPRQHLCCVVGSVEERARRVAAWTCEGLSSGERVVHVEAGGFDGPGLRHLDTAGVDWRARVRDGQLVVWTPEEAFLEEGAFDPERLARRHAALVERSRADGYRAVRVAAAASDALAVVAGRDGLLAYEAALESVSAAHPLSALCFYDRRTFAAELASFTRAHPRGLADNQVVARCEPGLVRLAGEVDISNIDLVTAALASAEPLKGDMVVDLRDLSFIGVAGVAELAAVARRLGPGQRLRVLDPGPQFTAILEVGGWQDLVATEGGRETRHPRRGTDPARTVRRPGPRSA